MMSERVEAVQVGNKNNSVDTVEIVKARHKRCC